jgi:hypothetical protein
MNEVDNFKRILTTKIPTLLYPIGNLLHKLGHSREIE